MSRACIGSCCLKVEIHPLVLGVFLTCNPEAAIAATLVLSLFSPPMIPSASIDEADSSEAAL